MTGYGAGEVIGHNPQRGKPGLGPAFHRQVEEAVGAGKVWRGEVPNRRKDGSCYMENITVAPVRDAGGGALAQSAFWSLLGLSAFVTPWLWRRVLALDREDVG